MNDFEFYTPTRIFFGKNYEMKIGEILAAYGFKKVLFVYGGGSIKRSGLYDVIINQFNRYQIEYRELGGIIPNPTVDFVINGISLLADFKTECILAVGGGSVIDVAKSIAVSYYYSGDPFDFNMRKVEPKRAIPVGAVPTIASAGSEASDSCVLTDASTHIKAGFNHPLNRPLFAIESPALTFDVSPYQTACGIVDMMMHSLERYFGSPSDENQLADSWALELCKNVIIAGKKAMKTPRDYDARAQLLLASTISHNGLTALGKEKPIFVVHPLEHALSGYSPLLAHGAGIAICYLGWARYVYKKDIRKFALLARKLFNIEEQDDEKASIMGINAMQEFYVSLGMPTSLRSVGLSETDLPSLIALASGNGTRVIGRYPQSLNQEDIKAIYTLCL